MAKLFIITAFVSVSPYCIRLSEGGSASRYLPPWLELIGKIRTEKDENI
jgi:hypothetical protein